MMNVHELPLFVDSSSATLLSEPDDVHVMFWTVPASQLSAPLGLVNVTVTGRLSVAEGHDIAKEVRHQLLHHLPHLDRVMVHVDPDGQGGDDHHHIGAHAHDGLATHVHD